MRALVLAGAVAVTVAGGGGCSSNDPCQDVIGACIALTVNGSGSVDTLRLGLSGAVEADRFAPTRQTLTTLPVYVALQLAHANSQTGAPFTGGDVRIDVSATHAGALVGAASTHVMLGSGDHVQAAVTLGSDPLPPADDLSATPTPAADLATACTTTDLAILAVDPHNCGGCGHDCLGGACMGGQCQPMVLAVVSGAAFGIAVDSDNVYFSRINGPKQGVLRQPLAGGAPIAIFASTTTTALELAFAGGTLVVDAANQHLETLPVPGGAAALTPGYDVGVNAVAADATHVYYASNADLTLRSIDLPLSAGSTPTDVGTPAQSATVLATDGTTLYYASNTVLGGITLPSGAPQTFANITNIAGLAVDGTTLWATTYSGSILKLARNGNVVSTVATLTTQPSPRSITVDASAVYWVNDTDGTVMRIAR